MNGRVVMVAIVFFTLGWLLHRSADPPEPAPAEPLPCVPMAASAPASKPVVVKRKKLNLAPPSLPHAPLLPSDYERLKTCFTGEAYRGSGFVLHLSTGDHGEVTRVRLVGDEFMTRGERDCVRGQVKDWQLGDNVEPDLVVKVTL